MELFAITCTTCKSKLKVRDPAAIGQILSCPKCGGMVMVKPPPAFSEATEQKSDLPTATEVEQPVLRFGETPASSAFDVLDELLSDAPPRAQQPRPAAPKESTSAPPPVPKPRFVGGPAHRSSTPPNGKSSGTVSAVAPMAPAALPPVKPQPVPSASAETVVAPPRPSKSSTNFKAPPPPAVGPNANGNSEKDAKPATPPRSNFWLLMAGSIVLGVGLALVAVCAVILLRPTGKARAGVVTDAKTPDGKPASALPTKEPQPSASTAAPVVAKAEPSAKTTESAESTPVSPVPQPDTVAATTETKPASAGDPLGLTTPPATPSPEPSTAKPSPDSLAKFDQILGNEEQVTKSATTTPAVPPIAVDTTPTRPAAPRPPLREIDVAKQLALPLPGIESTGTTLAEFVELMSDLSTIPITLEVPFLPATPESAVTLKAANTTVGAALKDALATLRLEYVVSDDQLIVRRPEPNPFAALTHDVKDLTGGEEQALHDLVELLQAVVEPSTWGDGEGQGSIVADTAKGTLAIRNRRTMQFQVLTAIEKLRASRSPPLPQKFPVKTSLFQLESRLKQAGPHLVKPVSLNFSQPTRLVDIFDRLGKVAGIRILVDWQDVAAAGWNPAGEGTLVASNQPLIEALESLLTPLDLTFRIIDSQTLQVVTPNRLNETAELEAFKVADLLRGEMTSDVLIAQARAALGDEIFIAGGGTGEIRFDDAGKCILAWLPQPKQRELEVLLQLLRGGGK